MARPPKAKAAPLAAPALPEPEESPAKPAAAPPDLEGSLDLFAQHSAQIEQTILDLVAGIRIALPVQKRKLSRGETEYEVETDQGETWWVYRQPPNVSLLKFVAEQIRGRAAQKEQQAQAATLLVQLALPGHDLEVDRYLATLPDEKLAKYDFDAVTLARLRAHRAA